MLFAMLMWVDWKKVVEWADDDDGAAGSSRPLFSTLISCSTVQFFPSSCVRLFMATLKLEVVLIVSFSSGSFPV